MKCKPLILFTILVSLLTFGACDIVDEPIDPDRDLITNGKKVLLEDFTGHTCGTCPSAHVLAENLKEEFGNDMILVTVHLGSFAVPDPIGGYPAEYRTPMGTRLGSDFTIGAAIPVGMVSRREFNGDPRTSKGSWSGHIATILKESPHLEIELEASYDASTMTATITTEMKYFVAGNADHHIVAIITEDSIISKQSDYSGQPDYVNDYVHMHMLRKSITDGNYGEPVKGAEIFVGERINRTFTTELDPSWVPENCNVVVYVLDASTREVLQVEEVHL